MAEEATREALLELLAQQAARLALLITQNSEQTAQIKLLIEENARLKKRIEQLERQVKRYVARHSREQPRVDPKPPGRRAGQGTFTFKHAPARDTVTRIIDVEPANICPSCQTPLDRAAYKTDLAFITELPRVQPEITQYNVPVTLCPSCGKDVRGKHPRSVPEPTRGDCTPSGPPVDCRWPIPPPRTGSPGTEGAGRVALAVRGGGDAERPEPGHHPHDGRWNAWWRTGIPCTITRHSRRASTRSASGM